MTRQGVPEKFLASGVTTDVFYEVIAPWLDTFLSFLSFPQYEIIICCPQQLLRQDTRLPSIVSKT